MRTPVIVDTPYPTLLETAKLMGVSPADAREIARVVDEIHKRNKKRRKKKKKRRATDLSQTRTS
jgi:hypothetical protein